LDGARERLAREIRSLRDGVNPRFGVADFAARLLPNYALCCTRAWLYRAAGCDISSSVTIQGALQLLGSGPSAGRLHVGTGTIIAPLVTLGLDSDVFLGRNVSVAPGTVFHTATHAIGFGSRRMQLPVIAQPIVVEDGVWIGARCVILPGIRIGRGSIVAAGSVVTENVPPNSFIEGNPAVIRETLPFGDR
jgi:maltose O-acetyltransferase